MPKRPLAKDLGDRTVAAVLAGLLRGVGTLPVDRALDLAASIGRRLGSRSNRTRIMLDGLERAFPDYSDEKRMEIARCCWGHQARLLVETERGGQLFDWKPDAPDGRVEVCSAIDLDARRDGKVPTLFFTAHLGCFEFLPATCNAIGLDTATLFRPPNNRYIADRLLQRREAAGTRFVAAGRGAARTLADTLRNGGSVGLLVDQKFRSGHWIDFFGTPAPTNPLVARLAELTGGEVVPAYCVRLPENRYRVVVEKPLRLPLDTGGKVEIETALRVVQGCVEDWVRAYPEQWMWFHRRWG